MRTFIAIELDGSVLDRVDAVRERLRAVGADVKWVERENTHLTIKFIGEINPDRAPEIAAVLGEAVERTPRFDIEVGGVGTFPPRRPRVLWVGTADPSGALARLHAELEDRLEKLGIEKDGRNFSPHITLGRVRGTRRLRALLEALDREQPAELGSSPVASVTLFESKLTPHGPVYSRLAEAQLPEGRSENHTQ